MSKRMKWVTIGAMVAMFLTGYVAGETKGQWFCKSQCATEEIKDMIAELTITCASVPDAPALVPVQVPVCDKETIKDALDEWANEQAADCECPDVEPTSAPVPVVPDVTILVKDHVPHKFGVTFGLNPLSPALAKVGMDYRLSQHWFVGAEAIWMQGDDGRVSESESMCNYDNNICTIERETENENARYGFLLTGRVEF